ncbi:CAP domain-containing protein [Zopfochytrium polystomum]|nr:CAP domain-containing protein [Zopfochytrium polystomum]
MDDTSPKNALGDMTNCLSNYTIQADDRCEAVAFQFQLTVTQLLQLNTYLDCVNLVSGSIVCVNGYVGNPPQLVPASASNATANATVVPVDGCLQLVTVSSSQNCIALTVRYGISVTDLYSWNANLNCWAFKNGDRVCVKAPATASIARNSTTSATSTSSKSSSSSSSTSSSSTSTTSTTSTVEITYPTTTEAPPEPTPTPTPEPQPQPQPDTSDEGATLSKHNSYRAQYGIPALSWSSGLAGEASSYASYLAYSNNCALVHSGASGEGENLASYGATAGAGHMAMSAAVDSWMTEDVNHYEHASQVVWRGSHEVGCGIATNTHSDGSFCEVVVCRYSPQGNIAPLQYYNS